MSKLIIHNDLLQSNASTSGITFASSAAPYINLSVINTNVDFTSLVVDYQAVKLRSITIQVRRVIPESVMNSVYTTGLVPISMAYYPFRISYNPGATVMLNNESSMLLDPMSITSITAAYRIPRGTSIVTSGGVNYCYSMTDPVPSNLFIGYPGCIAIGYQNTTAASSTTTLYSVRVVFDFMFSVPY
jgi:hypothetical protein